VQDARQGKLPPTHTLDPPKQFSVTQQPNPHKLTPNHYYSPCHMLRKQNKANNNACITSSHLSKSWGCGLQSRSRGGGVHASSSVFVMSCTKCWPCDRPISRPGIPATCPQDSYFHKLFLNRDTPCKRKTD